MGGNKSVAVLVVFVVCLVSIPVTPARNAFELVTAKAEFRAIIDGDTFDVAYLQGGEGLPRRIRPYLMDTPETFFGLQCFGRDATQQAYKFLEGKRFWLAHPHQSLISKSGDVDRLMAFVYLDGPGQGSFAAKMIRGGYAWLDARHPEEAPYVDELYALQRQAQEKAVGLWGACAAAAGSRRHQRGRGQSSGW